MNTQPRRRYTKRQKVTAVIAAEMSSNMAASAKLGVPETNIRRWRDDPELAKYVERTREELAEGAGLLAHRALEVISRRIDEFEPRDLTILFGVMVDKAQLLSGQPTARTESRDITADLDDHERATLRDAIDAFLGTAAEPAEEPRS